MARANGDVDYLRGEVTSFGRLEDADLGAINCKPFDASGVSECDISNSTVTVKQRKKDTVITRVSQHISEGC